MNMIYEMILDFAIYCHLADYNIQITTYLDL